MNIKVNIHRVIECFKFHIEQNISSLYVECKTKIKSPIMVLVYNSEGMNIGEIFFGYSNFVNYFYISNEKTTMNGLCHKLEHGEYSVMIITYSKELNKDENIIDFNIEVNKDKDIPLDFLQEEAWFLENKMNIDYDKYFNDESRYYKGDFHAHTFYSDGKNNGEQVREIIRKQELDFIALTEHNRIPFGFKELGCVNIPSFELTFDFGHVNVHRIHKNILNHLYNEPMVNIFSVFDNAIDIFREISNISINHMFLEPWEFGYGELDMTKINTLEIICDPTYPTSSEANDKAVRFLDFLWNSGFNIYGIGGSDSHNLYEDRYDGATLPSIYGDPSTYVYCDGLSINNIIKGIQKGHSYVTRFVELDINISDYKYLPGQQINNESETITYKVTIKNCVKDYRGRFIYNDEVIKEQKITNLNPTMDLTLENSEEHWWLRFGLYDEDNHVIAYINPIYNKLSKITETRLNILLEEFGEQDDKRHII